MMPPYSCRCSGQKPGNIFQHDQWNVKTIAKPHKPRSLHRGIDVQCSRQHMGLVCNDSNGLPPSLAKPTTIFSQNVSALQKKFHYPRPADECFDVVWKIGILRNESCSVNLPLVPGSSGVSRMGGSSSIVGWNIRQQLTDRLQASSDHRPLQNEPHH